MQIAYWILFVSLQFLSTEGLALGQGMPGIAFFAKENKERKALNERLQARKADFRSGKAEQDLSSLIQTRKPFTWESVTYDVPVSGGQKRLLDNIFGYVKPGTLTALMGASGAGKTTLLDVLANRKNIGVVGGDILVAGKAPGRDFQRGTAYCEQLDVHEFTQTVRDALRFSAYLRQPAETPKEEKDAYVEEVIQLLELEDIADAMIGFPGFGLGVEARKRLTIGVELAAKPQLLLFLDGPSLAPSSRDPTLINGVFRTHLWSRRSERLQHRPLPPQARLRRPSHPLHDPPAKRPALRELRPAPAPQARRSLRLLR